MCDIYIPDVQAGFRKGRGTRDQIANIRWIMEKAREFQKHYFCISPFFLANLKYYSTDVAFTYIKKPKNMQL